MLIKWFLSERVGNWKQKSSNWKLNVGIKTDCYTNISNSPHIPQILNLKYVLS